MLLAHLFPELTPTYTSGFGQGNTSSEKMPLESYLVRMSQICFRRFSSRHSIIIRLDYPLFLVATLHNLVEGRDHGCLVHCYILHIEYSHGHLASRS